MLPSYSGLYRDAYSGSLRSVVVRFFGFEQGNFSQITLLFTPLYEEMTLIETFVSHDDWRLNVLAPVARGSTG